MTAGEWTWGLLIGLTAGIPVGLFLDRIIEKLTRRADGRRQS